MMAKRIFRNTFFITLVAILVASILVIGVLFQVFDEQSSQELRNSARLISDSLEGESKPLAYLDNLVLGGIRITWIAADGTVLFDNVAIASQMENHANRPEIQQALLSGAGQSQRFSATLAQKTKYYALFQNDGTVLRTSITTQSIWGIVLGLLPAFAAIVCAVLLLSLIISSRVARRTLQPINDLDLEHPIENDVYEELSPLLNRLAEQNIRINLQMDELVQRQQELTAITENMQEGLVMLNPNQHILSINRSAQQLFHVDQQTCTGRHVLALCRDFAFESAVQDASQGRRSETMLHIGGRQYQLVVNPVIINAVQAGTVLLLMDITERADAERLRREFSANVSHELKTPLTSISGYAEIMKDGLAKPEDTKSFAGRIYNETNRLIALVDDILRLSKLDEGNIDAAMENVDLLALSNDVVKRLTPLAQSRNVTVHVDGQPHAVYGARIVLDEMIFNLCENAIKYNKPDGRVDITIGEDEHNVILTVADTGIGIPSAQQDKVFERFYRADKSHSHDFGGTGLGLSIVKHGARFHNARVDLTSTVGVGTRIALFFPKIEDAQ